MKKTENGQGIREQRRLPPLFPYRCEMGRGQKSCMPSSPGRIDLHSCDGPGNCCRGRRVYGGRRRVYGSPCTGQETRIFKKRCRASALTHAARASAKTFRGCRSLSRLKPRDFPECAFVDDVQCTAFPAAGRTRDRKGIIPVILEVADPEIIEIAFVTPFCVYRNEFAPIL